MEMLINEHTIDNFCMMLEKSLERFIEYAVHYSCKNPEYVNRIWIAKWLMNHYQTDVALHILNFVVYETKHYLNTRHVFPHETLEVLKGIQHFVFDGSEKETEPMSLAYQNGLSSAYEPFDFSVRCVTTIEKEGL